MRNQHIKAEIIADSITSKGDRLTSFVLTIPRIVLAEFNTHRALSRNSASSRAIPLDTMVKKVQDTPFIPIAWQKEHKGMQGTEYFTEDDYEETDEPNSFKTIDSLDYQWLQGRDSAVKAARILSKTYGVTKQFCNRLLEPFLYHTIIATASEWQNFLALRAHSAAEIHIADVSYKMLEIYNNSTPTLLEPGSWHIPFGDKMDQERIFALVNELYPVQPASLNWFTETAERLMVKIATARCARVSYLNYEGTDDYQKDINLHNRLSSMGHWSCFEHPGTAMSQNEYFRNRRTYKCSNIEHLLKDVERGVTKISEPENGEYLVTEYGWSGNFRGFNQYRKMFDGENKMDTRVVFK